MNYVLVYNTYISWFSVYLVWSFYLCLLAWSCIYCTYWRVHTYFVYWVCIDFRCSCYSGTDWTFLLASRALVIGEGAGGPLPWHWGATKTAAIGSMGDLFHDGEWITAVFCWGIFPKTEIQVGKEAFQRFERCVSVVWLSLFSAACSKFQAPCSRKELNIAVDNKAKAKGNVFQPWHVYRIDL